MDDTAKALHTGWACNPIACAPPPSQRVAPCAPPLRYPQPPAAAYALPRKQQWLAARHSARLGLAACNKHPGDRGGCAAAVLHTFLRVGGDESDFNAVLHAWNVQWAGHNACPPGWRHAAENAVLQCSPCLPGSFALVGKACKTCEIGSFSNSSAATSCYNCSSRSVSGTKGATMCHVCAAGRMANAARTACRDTPGLYAEWQRLPGLQRVGALAAAALASVILLVASVSTANSFRARRTAFQKPDFWGLDPAQPLAIVASVGASPQFGSFQQHEQENCKLRLISDGAI